jgi:hypothetical protein
VCTERGEGREGLRGVPSRPSRYDPILRGSLLQEVGKRGNQFRTFTRSGKVVKIRIDGRMETHRERHREEGERGGGRGEGPKSTFKMRSNTQGSTPPMGGEGGKSIPSSRSLWEGPQNPNRWFTAPPSCLRQFSLCFSLFFQFPPVS